jgi:hypothetical protein
MNSTGCRYITRQESGVLCGSIKFFQPNDVKPAQEIQLAETENKTIFEEAVKIKASQLFPKYFIFFKNLPSSGGMIDCLMWQ